MPGGGAITSGLTRIVKAMIKIVPSKTGFKYRLGISAAAVAPHIPPIIVGTSIGTTAGRSKVSCLSNPANPTKHCRVTAMRFVPFATSAGRPSIISTGRVKFEPPPATVFIPPAKKPVAASKMNDESVMSKASSCLVALLRVLYRRLIAQRLDNAVFASFHKE